MYCKSQREQFLSWAIFLCRDCVGVLSINFKAVKQKLFPRAGHFSTFFRSDGSKRFMALLIGCHKPYSKAALTVFAPVFLQSDLLKLSFAIPFLKKQTCVKYCRAVKSKLFVLQGLVVIGQQLLSKTFWKLGSCQCRWKQYRKSNARCKLAI